MPSFGSLRRFKPSLLRCLARQKSSIAVQCMKLDDIGRTPETEGVSYEMPFIQTNPKSSTNFLGIHGTPGRLEDFLPLAESLSEKMEVNFIAVTLPDLDFTLSTKKYHNGASDKLGLVLQFLQRSGIKEIDTIIGHSSGSYPAYLTATASSRVKVRSVVTICGTGTSAVGHLSPVNIHTHVTMPLLYNNFTRNFLLAFTRLVLDINGFHSMSARDALASLHTQLMSQYWKPHNARRWLQQISERKLPHMMIAGEQDRLIRTHRETAKIIGNPHDEDHYFYGGDDGKTLVQKPENLNMPTIVRFMEGGHWLMLKYPDIIADHLLKFHSEEVKATCRDGGET